MASVSIALLLIAVFIAFTLFWDANQRNKQLAQERKALEERMHTLAEQAGFSRSFRLDNGAEPTWDDGEPEWWTATPFVERRVKIVSNGMSLGTKVYDADTGKMLPGITEMTWHHRAGDWPELHLRVIAPPAQFDLPVVGQLSVEEVSLGEVSSTQADAEAS